MADPAAGGGGAARPQLPAALLAFLHGNAAQANSVPQSTALGQIAPSSLLWLQLLQNQQQLLQHQQLVQRQERGWTQNAMPVPSAPTLQTLQSSATAPAPTASVAPTSAPVLTLHSSTTAPATTAPASIVPTSAACHPLQSSTTAPAPLASVAPASAACHPLQSSTSAPAAATNTISSQMSAQAERHQQPKAAAEQTGKATEAGGTSARVHPHTEVGGRVSVFWDGAPPLPWPRFFVACARSLRQQSY
jgi:hypothetical protein